MTNKMIMSTILGMTAGSYAGYYTYRRLSKTKRSMLKKILVSLVVYTLVGNAVGSASLWYMGPNNFGTPKHRRNYRRRSKKSVFSKPI